MLKLLYKTKGGNKGGMCMAEKIFVTKKKEWFIKKDMLYAALYDLYQNLISETENKTFKPIVRTSSGEKANKKFHVSSLIAKSEMLKACGGAFYDKICDKCTSGCEYPYDAYQDLIFIEDDEPRLSKNEFVSILEKNKGLVMVTYARNKDGKEGKIDLKRIVGISTDHGYPYVEIGRIGGLNIFFNPFIIDKALDTYAVNLKVGDNNLIDLLVSVGIPEEALHKNISLWHSLQSIQKNEFVSKNQTFFITDKNKEEWLLKFTRNKQRAFLETAASYYLSENFDFILPGKFPEPVESNGVYMIMQKSARKLLAVQRSIDYWLWCFALFHRDAEKILRENKVNISNVSFRYFEQEKERYSLIKRIVDFPLVKARLEDAINYLYESDYKRVIHNDNKPEHRIGKHLVDLELIGKGHPGLDLSMLFMQYKIPMYAWDMLLKKYLSFKGVASSFDKEFKELQKGVFEGAYVAICRELISYPFRFPRLQSLTSTQKSLLDYLPKLKA